MVGEEDLMVGVLEVGLLLRMVGAPVGVLVRRVGTPVGDLEVGVEVMGTRVVMVGVLVPGEVVRTVGDRVGAAVLMVGLAVGVFVGAFVRTEGFEVFKVGFLVSEAEAAATRPKTVAPPSPTAEAAADHQPPR